MDRCLDLVIYYKDKRRETRWDDCFEEDRYFHQTIDDIYEKNEVIPLKKVPLSKRVSPITIHFAFFSPFSISSSSHGSEFFLLCLSTTFQFPNLGFTPTQQS